MVQRVRLRGKVIHFVVKEKSRTFDDDVRTVSTVQGRGQRYRVAVSIHDREVRCLLTLVRKRPSVHAGGDPGAIWIKPVKALSRIALVNELLQRHAKKIRVAEVLRAICVGPSFGFDHQMHDVGTTVSHRTDGKGFHHVEHLDQQGTTRGRRWHRHDGIIAIGTDDGIPPY